MWDGILFDNITERDFFTKACSDKTRDNVFKVKKGKFKLDIRKKKVKNSFSMLSVVRLESWN